ncbi:glycosyltransferase family 4 protein [bacterium]|nr:glycosyltransferase family 4 protein [bacterium]
MRIGIDARFYGTAGKGLGRYTQKLIENLERIDGRNQYFVFLKKENFGEYQPKNKNFQKVLADYRWYTFSEQINMPRILNKYNLDLVHFPHFNVPLLYRGKLVITIHDLILIHFPTVRGTTLNPFFYWIKFLAYKIVIWSAIKKAKKIITVSEFTKDDILKNYKVPENKIKVTYEACDNFRETPVGNDEEILRRRGIMKPYLLYVGNAYPHKNLERLILAFKEVNKIKKDLKLVLAGKEDYFYHRLKKMTEKRNIKNVIFAGFVSDRDLSLVYRQASLYVFPSLYEGFGLPPLEAMAEGTPVISSDHQCMREVLGNSAYYFDARKPDEIAEAIIKVLDDEKLREKLTARGYEQIKKYSWEKMAGETLDVYYHSTT